MRSRRERPPSKTRRRATAGPELLLLVWGAILVTGVLAAIAVLGFFSFANVALLEAWHLHLALLDMVYAVVACLAMGVLAWALSRAKA